jgi:hypothetical protein
LRERLPTWKAPAREKNDVRDALKTTQADQDMDDHHYPAFSYKANLLDGHKIEIMTTETNLLVDAIAQARARTLNMVIKDSLDHDCNF